jgi:periplasmic divalent cation tolerance protein
VREAANGAAPIGEEDSAMKKTNWKRVVLVTCGSLPEARRIARSAVEARLAACVNILRAPVESIYRWKGAVETAREYLLLIKTTKKSLGALEKTVRRLHSYDLPEFIALPIAEGSRAYLNWLENCLSDSRTGAPSVKC